MPTELCLATHEAQAVKSHLAAIVEASADPILSESPDGTIRSWNAAAVQLFGYDAAEIIGQPITILIPPALLAERAEIVARLKNGERIVHFETSRRAKIGRAIDVSLSIAPIRDSHGEIIGVSTIMRDITERKLAEVALRESEERFRALVRASSDAVYRMSPDWTKLRYLVGRDFIVDTEEPSRTWLQKYIHPGDLPRAVAVIHDAIRTKSVFELEHRVVRADGSTGWIHSRAIPILDAQGEITEWFATASDVTDRKRAEAELERTRHQLAEGQRIAHLGSWEYIVATQTTVWSDEEKRIYGLDPSRPSPDYDALLRHHIHPDDAPELDRRFRAALEYGAPFENENRIIRPDGAIRWIYNKAQPYFDDQGKLLRYIGATLDITERKVAEEALREADRRKDEFLAMLAHELRNPLAPIRNGLQILQLDGVDSAKTMSVRAMMARQVDHLVRLVDDLLEVSRFSRGRIELRKERLDLAQVVNDAVAASQPHFTDLGHHLTVSLPSESLPLEADPTRLAQVLTNLLNNAAKFTHRGGRIEISARREDREAVVSVRDSGVGIPANELRRIFDLFTQIDNSLDHSRGGLGIGLALAGRLVELHGGCVEARSEGVGRGSEFVVRLPLADSSVAEPVGVATEDAAPGSVRRVLVVDDDRDVADSFVLLLDTLDAEVRVAYDGRSALDIVAAFKPELVFLDLGMPNMNGYETARRIRQLRDGRSLLLVAMTGWGQEEDRHKTREAGFDKHLVKPMDFGHVQALLANGADKRDATAGAS